jgi:glycerophosphoryl diester phosphodiesterase
MSQRPVSIRRMSSRQSLPQSPLSFLSASFAWAAIMTGSLVGGSLLVGSVLDAESPGHDAHAPSTFLIAHRGASAYAPEHTIESYRLAIEQGADYVEPDLTLTKDNILVCSHDPFLERVTNVAEVFPDRFTETKTGDKATKHWFIEDFTLAEIKRLDHGSWFDPKFKGLQVLTFQEMIDFVGNKAGLFPELKTPARLHAKGFDPEKAIAEILTKNNLVKATVKGRPAIQLQVFEQESLQRLTTLLPTLPRHFLMGSPADVQKWLTPDGLKQLKTFASGIAPARQIIDAAPDIVARAHDAGIAVVPYTFQLRPKSNPYPDAPPEMLKMIEQAYKAMPDTREALTADMRKFVVTYKVDGLFTDNPDLFPR